MNKLVLKSNEPTEENILAIINYVRALERENGLSDEEISYKYTHGECESLVCLICYLLPKVRSVRFNDSSSQTLNEFSGKEDEKSHFCVAIKGNPETDDKLYGDTYNRYFYDINGKKYYDEMCYFVANEYGDKIDESKISCHYEETNNTNEVVINAAKNIIISSKKEYKDSIPTKENIMSLNDIIQINEELLQEFTLSQLSVAQKTENYVKKINEIIKKYKEYVIKTPEWRTRFTEVNEFLQRIPFFNTYRYNDSIDRNKNRIAELEYYQNIATQIYEYIESKKNKPRKL